MFRKRGKEQMKEVQQTIANCGVCEMIICACQLLYSL